MFNCEYLINYHSLPISFLSKMIILPQFMSLCFEIPCFLRMRVTRDIYINWCHSFTVLQSLFSHRMIGVLGAERKISAVERSSYQFNLSTVSFSFELMPVIVFLQKSVHG